MVTVRKWGGVSLGRTVPAETARRYKTNGRSVLRREKKAREEEEKRARSGCKLAKEEKKGSVWCAFGCLTSANNETIRPSQCLSKRACGACVGVSSADGE